ncbi:MAG: ImmA/IrrE family metallo-endopeptidase [Sporichthyaceae bacterium]
MSRGGWNPSRRNRNIGTAKSGHGRDNRLTIPERWSDDRVFWERLRDPVVVRRSDDETDFVVLVEPVLDGFTHCCTPDDVFAVADMIPVDDLDDLRLFVLRQPTRKQLVLSSVWGRMAYFADLGRLSGPAVYLEAQELGRPSRERRSMSVDERREFERLVADGHRVEETSWGYRWEPRMLDATRATQLYRTLLHEAGHQADYLRSVDRPRDALPYDHPEWDRLGERYWAKSNREKEVFAHRYAEELGARLRREGKIPFDRMADPDRLREEGLNPSWFGLPA